MAGSAIEPPAELRAFAAQLYLTYVALTNEGFSKAQAIGIVTELLRGAMPGRGGGS